MPGTVSFASISCVMRTRKTVPSGNAFAGPGRIGDYVVVCIGIFGMGDSLCGTALKFWRGGVVVCIVGIISYRARDNKACIRIRGRRGIGGVRYCWWRNWRFWLGRRCIVSGQDSVIGRRRGNALIGAGLGGLASRTGGSRRCLRDCAAAKAVLRSAAARARAAWARYFLFISSLRTIVFRTCFIVCTLHARPVFCPSMTNIRSTRRVIRNPQVLHPKNPESAFTRL